MGTQASLEPLIDLTRILTVIIYGNPVLGPTGEDPTGIYVEELLDMAYAARDGYTLKPFDLITEIPKKRVFRRGGLVSSRHALYKEFSVVHVENEMESLKKAAYEYKNEGNQTLFAQAVTLAKKNNLVSTGSAMQLPEYDFTSNTFLTGVGLVGGLQPPGTSGGDGTGGGGGGRGGGGSVFNGNMSINGSVLSATGTGLGGAMESYRERAVADNVMKDVAKEMNLLDLSDIDRLRRKMNREEDPQQGSIPLDIFDRSITDPNPLTTYPVALNTALKSLRYAIEHPLTDHNALPSSLCHPTQHHVRQTVTSEKRQMPRRTPDGEVLQLPVPEKKIKSPPVKVVGGKESASGNKGKNEEQTQQQLKSDGSASLSLMINKKPTSGTLSATAPSVFKQSMNVRQRQSTVQTKQHINKQLRNTTLQQIEEVLDGLNKNSQEIISRNTGGGQLNGPDSVMVRGVARPNTGVKGLIDMVNNVVFDLQS
jgi:hypothetical protein